MCNPTESDNKEAPPHMFGRGGWSFKAVPGALFEGKIPKKAKGYTFEEVAKYDLMVIKGKAYDIRSFIEQHPGGSVIRSYLGRDASDAFSAFHDQKTWLKLKDFYVGDIQEGEKEAAAESPMAHAFRDLRAEFVKEGLFDSSGLYYLWKVASTLALCAAALVVLARWAPESRLGFYASAALMGLFFQQTGWLAHDHSHNQVFKDRRLNKGMTLFLGNVCQGFSRHWWNTKHNRHHAVPNALDEEDRPLDEDIDTLPLLLWDDRMLKEIESPAVRSFLKLQHVLLFPILSLARFAWSWGSIMTVVQGEGMKGAYRVTERLTLALHYLWYLGSAAYFLGPLSGLAYFVVSQLVAGLTLSFVFVQSHNGMEVYHTKEYDFFSAQMVSTRDVDGGIFVDWFMGGLNYQIEHHLFPTMPRHNLHKIQDRVRAACEAHNVPFESCSMAEATRRVTNRLREVAKLI